MYKLMFGLIVIAGFATANAAPPVPSTAVSETPESVLARARAAADAGSQ
jgi:hypothetical protein